MTKFLEKSFSSRPATDGYRDNWEAVFGKKESTSPEPCCCLNPCPGCDHCMPPKVAPTEPKTPFDPEAETAKRPKPPCAVCRLPLNLCVCAVSDS